MSFVRDTTSHILRVGIIGCGEVAQVIHIPVLGFLCELFSITYLCDVSQQALDFTKARVVGSSNVRITKDPKEVCGSPDVDVVFVLSSDEYHADHAIMALSEHKHVMIEKPAALNFHDLARIQRAEDASRGRVMVGYMRRYAAAFEEAIKEAGGLDQVLYARVRDIIGPPQAFVSQSGTFPKRFQDFSPEDSKDLKARGAQAVSTAFEECDVQPTDSKQTFWRYLCGLGVHDISAMRELLGMPAGKFDVGSVLFEYEGFNVVYESGIDNVPRFDAHIEVYGKDKTVKITYDTPYVKGLPIILRISENSEGAYKETTVRTTFEDAYTQELRKLHTWVTEGKPIKTTLADSEDDLRILKMIMKNLK